MELALAMRELVRDIASSHDDRTKRVVEIRKETWDLIESCRASRREEATQMRRQLVQGATERKSEVAAMLRGFQSSRREEAAQMRRELAQGVAERKSAVNAMRSDFHKAQAEVRAELKEAATAWQELSQIMETKRAGVKLPLREEVPIAKEELAAVAAEEELPDLEAKLLGAIERHPGGITLGEVAEALGVVPVVLGRPARRLLDKGKIRKEEKLHFPVTSE